MALHTGGVLIRQNYINSHRKGKNPANFAGFHMENEVLSQNLIDNSPAHGIL
jgi:hypothetical protein